MKIAIVIERMDTERGGREASTAQVAVELARRGHEVTILCQSGQWDGQPVRLRVLSSRGLWRVSRLRAFAADLQREIAGGRFDVVHAMLPVPGANVYQLRGGTVPGQRHAAIRRRSILERPLVMAVQPLNLCRRQLERMEQAVASDPGVLCLPPSRMVAQELERYYGRREGVRVVYNAVDVPDPRGAQRAEWRRRLRDGMGLNDDAVAFLVVARNFALKGVAESIIAFARWYHSRRGGRLARLVILGREAPEGYQRHANLRDVAGAVVFVPHTPEVFQWYAAADVCMLLSWYDPCSRVVLEAARWGIPSITTVFNGAAELLADGAGIVVKSPRDFKVIVPAMERMADPDGRAAFSTACNAMADQLSIRRHVDELLQAYAQLLGRA